MIPMTCPGGYSVPLRAGKFEVIGVRATVSDPTAASRVTIYDDGGITDPRQGRILSSTFDMGSSTDHKSMLICDAKGIANLDANLEVLFPEPLKTRYGTSISNSSNVIPGTIQLYYR